MPDKHATQNPAPESPPRATPAAQAAARRMLSALKKWWMPLTIAVLGLVSVFAAIKVYPKPSESPAPFYSILYVTTKVPKIEFVKYDVYQVSSDIAKVRVWLVSNAGPQTKGRFATLSLQPPAGTYFRECPPPDCRFIQAPPYPAATIWEKTVTFGTVKNMPHWSARTDFFVKARHFGVTFNDLNVSAAMPDVIYTGNKGAFLLASYQIPSAARYDWSSFPVDATARTKADWSEPMPPGETAGRIAVGADQAAQTRKDFKIFIAGALIALAGAALLTAATEALHIPDWEAFRRLRRK